MADSEEEVAKVVSINFGRIMPFMIGEVLSTLPFRAEGANLHFFTSMEKHYLARQGHHEPHGKQIASKVAFSNEVAIDMLERLRLKRIHDKHLNLKVQGTMRKVLESLNSEGVVKLLRYLS